MTFEEWLKKEQPLVAGGAKYEEENEEFGPFRNARDAMEIAWAAACEHCARAQSPMLRDMISRGKAADNCRALKVLSGCSAK